MTPGPLNAASYFYLSSEGRQQGPVSGDQIRAKLRSGEINPDRYVWREGLPEWAPARSLPEFADAVHEAGTPGNTPPVVNAPPTNAVHATFAATVREPWGGTPQPPARIKPSTLSKLFTAWIVSMVGVVVLIVVGLAMMAIPLIANHGQFQDHPPVVFFVGIVALAVGGSLSILPSVFHHILVYWYWRLIQDGHAETTPGKATGFLFIPMFQYYWMFVAYWGLAKDLNAYADRHGVEIRRPNPGLALTAIITLIAGTTLSACLWMLPLPFVLIPWFIVMFQLHRGALDVARAIVPETASV